MKTFLSAAIVAATTLVAGASSASAFTTWSTFEKAGYTVKARYDDGALRQINAVNAQTGDVFKGFVSRSGIAVIETANGVQRINLNDLDSDNRTTVQDLALLK
jgi:hypothetical protein